MTNPNPISKFDKADPFVKTAAAVLVPIIFNAATKVEEREPLHILLIAGMSVALGVQAATSVYAAYLRGSYGLGWTEVKQQRLEKVTGIVNAGASTSMLAAVVAMFITTLNSMHQSQDMSVLGNHTGVNVSAVPLSPKASADLGLGAVSTFLASVSMGAFYQWARVCYINRNRGVEAASILLGLIGAMGFLAANTWNLITAKTAAVKASDKLLTTVAGAFVLLMSFDLLRLGYEESPGQAERSTLIDGVASVPDSVSALSYGGLNVGQLIGGETVRSSSRNGNRRQRLTTQEAEGGPHVAMV